MRLFYSDDYVLAAHGFDTTRKARWIADSLLSRPVAGVEMIAPAPLSESELCRIHTAEYVAAVKTGAPRHLAESQGFGWDPGLWGMVCASNGGVCEAWRAALEGGVSGSLSSGLHHARRERGAGYCTFNGLALAAIMSLEDVAPSMAARSVLILDLDAHCGGGTHSLISGEPRIRQLDIATSPFDRYFPTEHNTLDLIDDADDYLPTLHRRLDDLQNVPFDLCLYNAGMDVDRRSAIGGVAGLSQQQIIEREATVFRWAQSRGMPIAFVLAGGYCGDELSQDDLVALHRITIETAAGVRIAGP